MPVSNTSRFWLWRSRRPKQGGAPCLHTGQDPGRRTPHCRSSVHEEGLSHQPGNQVNLRIMVTLALPASAKTKVLLFWGFKNWIITHLFSWFGVGWRLFYYSTLETLCALLFAQQQKMPAWDVLEVWCSSQRLTVGTADTGWPAPSTFTSVSGLGDQSQFRGASASGADSQGVFRM